MHSTAKTKQEQKVALVTGFTGQDGTFLTKYLLENGYRVLGMVRRVSTEPPRRVRGKFDFSEYLKTGQLELVEGDLLSVESLLNIFDYHWIDEVYNLAAQSHVGLSFKQPEFTIESDFLGVVNLITAMETNAVESCRMYQASTSEMFGDYYSADKDIQMTEVTPLRPNSPYAIAKTAAHQYCAMKRAQGLFISCGILFNHESEIRGGDFVTQKIVRGAAHWQATGEPFELGNLDALRDWGYAGDYVKAMHAMLQVETASDYVVATGQTHSVREFVEAAFAGLGLAITWEGDGIHEKGLVNGRVAVEINPKFYRPNDVNYLNGAADKAYETLGWIPETSFDQMVEIMVKAAQG